MGLFMKSFFTALFLFLILSIPHHAYADPEDNVRFYIGAKLGYHGLIPHRIKDLSLNTLGQTTPITSDVGVLSVFTIGGAGGIHIQILPRLRSRTELEYLYHFEGKAKRINDGTGQLSQLNIASHTLLVNTYIDYDIIKFVALYLGVGIGTSILEADVTKEKSTGQYKSSKVIANFAWQIGIGSRIELTEYIFLDVNFRYLNLGAIKAFGNETGARVSVAGNNAIELLFSASYVF